MGFTEEIKDIINAYHTHLRDYIFIQALLLRLIRIHGNIALLLDCF